MQSTIRNVEVLNLQDMNQEEAKRKQEKMKPPQEYDSLYCAFETGTPTFGSR
jgi:hypothetical protein